MRQMHKGQRGFTLIELLVALPIAAAVVAAASSALIPIIQSSNASVHMVAIRQVQTAGYWVSTDGLQAQTVTTGASAGFPLTLTWTVTEKISDNEYRTESHTINYTLESKEIKRTDTINTISTDATGIIKSNTTTQETAVVGQYIESASCQKFVSGEAFTFNVTATVSGARGPQTETRTYEIQPRPLS